MRDLLTVRWLLCRRRAFGSLARRAQIRGGLAPAAWFLTFLFVLSFKKREARLICVLRQVITSGLLGATQAFAAPVDLCDDAARHAARHADVPTNVLRAIAKVETGRSVAGTVKAWPWTVNIEGKGYWFESDEEAQSFVRAAYMRGARSFDIGCFQINFRWHGAAFESFETMFDPMENALYAARFLQELRREMGSWAKAVGAYHSRQPQRAQGYRDRVEDVYAGLDEMRSSEPVATSRQRLSEPVLSSNGYPLLQHADGVTRSGSLVPMGETRRYIIRLDQTVAVGF